MATNAVTLKLLADTKGIRDGISQTNNQLGTLQSGLSKTTKFVKNLAIGFVAFKAIGAVTDSFKEAAQSVQEQEKLLAQTNAVLKSTGAAAGVTADGVLSLSDAIEKKSLIDAEQIQSAQNMLLTFTNVKNGVGAGNDVFNQATQTIADMSTALGQDTSASAVQLGKALNDPIKGVTALSKVGVSFTEDQKKQIKTLVEAGDTMGAQKIILKELGKEFGGSAAAAGDTFAGKIKHLKDTWDGFVETIVKKALPILTTVADYIVTNVVPAVQDFATWVGDNIVPALKDFGGWVQKNSTWLGALGVAIGVVAAAFLAYQAYLSIVSGITKAYTAIQLALNAVMAINPFVMILVGIVALVAAFIYAYKNSETFRNIVIGVWNAVKGAVMSVLNWFTGTLWPGIQAVWNGIVAGLKWLFTTYVGIWATIINFVRAVPGKIMGFFAGIAGWFGNVWTSIKNGAVNGFNSLVNFVKGIPGNILNAVGNVGSLLYGVGKKIITGLINGIKNMFGSVKDTLGNLTSKLTSWKGPESVDRKLLFGAGQLVIGGFINGLESQYSGVHKSLAGLTTDIGNTSIGGPGLALAVAGRGSGNTYNITVEVPPTADLASLGMTLKRAIAEADRVNGR